METAYGKLFKYTAKQDFVVKMEKIVITREIAGKNSELPEERTYSARLMDENGKIEFLQWHGKNSLRIQDVYEFINDDRQHYVCVELTKEVQDDYNAYADTIERAERKQGTQEDSRKKSSNRISKTELMNMLML